MLQDIANVVISSYKVHYNSKLKYDHAKLICLYLLRCWFILSRRVKVGLVSFILD